MDKPGVQLQAGKEDTAFLDDVDGGKKAAAKADSTCPSAHSLALRAPDSGI